MVLLCSSDTSLAGDSAPRVAAELADAVQAELVALDEGAGDPAPRLLAAARAAGCDRLVVGFAPRAGLAGARLRGWEQRTLLDAPYPAMLIPRGSPLRDGTVVLGHDVPQLPHQAAGVAGQLAARLRAPLIITHVLAVGAATALPVGRIALHGRPVLTQGAGTGGLRHERHAERAGRAWAQPAIASIAGEAALVVIGGRGSGRTLLPRRPRASRPRQAGRLPIVVTAGRAWDR